MGSGALKNHNPIRITAETREWLSPTLHAMMSNVAPLRGARIGEVPAYRTKPSFGDLDFVVESTWFELLAGGLAPLEEFARAVGPASGPIIVKNGGVNSVGVWVGDHRVPEPGIFQVDLISAPADRYNFTMSYLSWNDVGNMIGRISRLADLKFGHDGLWFTIRQGDRFFEDVLITLDWWKAIHFLGFDPLWWKDGFDNIEDIHEFVRRSRYFTPDAFFARNQRDRYRDEKRPVYGSFVRGLEENPPLKFEGPPHTEGQARLDWVLKEFPEARPAIEDALERARLRVAARDKFNASMVMRLTGLTGPPLGKVMEALRRQQPTQQDMDRMIDGMSQPDIEAMILRTFKEVTDATSAV